MRPTGGRSTSADEPASFAAFDRRQIERLRRWWEDEASVELDFLQKLEELIRTERWEQTGLTKAQHQRPRRFWKNRPNELEYLLEVASRILQTRQGSFALAYQLPFRR